MLLNPQLLLEQAQAGSDDSRGQLLASYTDYLNLMPRVQIGRRIQGKVDPADVVQETFLDAHRQFAQFRGTTEAELTSWLRRILAGQMAPVYRKVAGPEARDVKLELQMANDLDQSSAAMDRGFVAATSSPSHRASRREQAVLLAAALDRLSESYREVIILRNLEGHPFAEVASRMGRSEDSVHKLYVRALAELRDAMGGE